MSHRLRVGQARDCVDTIQRWTSEPKLILPREPSRCRIDSIELAKSLEHLYEQGRCNDREPRCRYSYTV